MDLRTLIPVHGCGPSQAALRHSRRTIAAGVRGGLRYRLQIVVIMFAAAVIANVPRPGMAQTLGDLMAMQQRFNDGEYAQALQIAQPLAVEGVPRATYLLGIANLWGMGLPANPGEAERWLTLAADAGYTRAMFILGDALLNGWDGVEPDKARALTYLERAAEADHAGALTALSYHYGCPSCSKADQELAAIFSRRAVGVSEADTFYRLGYLMENGIGLPKDEAGARRLYQIAGLLGSGSAANDWGHMALNGLGGPQDIPEAMQAFALGVDVGYVRSGHNIATAMFEHPDLFPDRALALAWCMWSVREADDTERAEFAGSCKTAADASTQTERSAAVALLPTIDADALR